MGRRMLHRAGESCQQCGRNRKTAVGRQYKGRTYYRALCDSCQKSPRRYLGECCARCGFVPEHPIQLQIDHIVPRARGGSSRWENLQTLCANCHCLKTLQEDGYGQQGVVNAVAAPVAQLRLLG